MNNSKPQAAILASPGTGHLIPILELAKCLVTQHGLDITVFVVTTDASLSQSQLHKLSPDSGLLTVVLLPPVDISTITKPTTAILSQIAMMMREALPSFHAAVSAMKVPPAALIVDLFGTEAFAVADNFNMRKYVFVTSNAWFLALTVHMPTFDKEMEDHILNQEPLLIPSCRPIRSQDTFFELANLDRDDQLYVDYVNMGIEIPKADGILVNTWQDLESTTLGALKHNKNLGLVTKVPVYPVGPLIRSVETGSGSEILGWLDMQPKESVLYVSFGSGGTLSAKQTTELAWGLELSQQRFVWVVRPPVDNDAAATLFKAAGNRRDDSPYYLPDGFITRIENKGLVVTTWAPQEEILSHPSIGGFLSHCGWNSALESMVNGVPMIAWPLYAEQKMNATMLTEEIQVAIRSTEFPADEVLRRKDIEIVVRKIMKEKEGDAIRAQVKKLKPSAKKATSKGGSSYNAMSHVAKECKIRHHSLRSKALAA